MNAKDQPRSAAAPIIAAQVSRIDVLGDVGAWYRAAGNCGYRAVLTFGDGSADVVLQSERR